MIFVDETKKAIDIVLLKNNSPKVMSIGELFSFYYKATLIPLILAVLVVGVGGVVIGSTLGGVFGSIGTIFGGFLGSGVALLAIIFVILMFWVLIPIGLIIDAAIFQVFGKLLGQFKQSYVATLNALIYASFVESLLFFLMIIPFLGIIISIIEIIWAFISSIVWLARFQKISGLMAFVVMFVATIVISIIVFVILGSLFVLRF